MRSLLVAVLLLTACASAPIRQADLARLAEADANIRRGCYTCLVTALETYEALAVGRARPVLLPRLFETHLLIGLRLAELAQDPSDSFEQAAAMADQLPTAVDAGFLVEAARAIPPDAIGTPRRIWRDHLDARQNFVETVLPDAANRLDRATISADLRDYLAASLTCLAAAAGVRSSTQVPPVIPADIPPLVRYRLGTCPIARDTVLDEVVASVPEFVEAGYFRARMPALDVTADYVRTQRLRYAEAVGVFPASPSVAYSLGALSQVVGDCRAAIDHYEHTLDLAPRHEDAALQRIICLGYQGLHENAINAASRVIDAGYDNRDEAYYWRAWNHHRLRQLSDARGDIDQAIAIGISARALTLGGIIKYDQNDLPLAERDLNRALQMDPTQCIARWYLGLVSFARELWISTGDDFAASAACYRQSAEQTERQLREVQNADLDPDFKASQILGFQAAIQEDRSQEQASYLNAANGFVRSDNHDRARDMLAGIPDDSLHAPGARELRRYLDELDAPPLP